MSTRGDLRERFFDEILAAPKTPPVPVDLLPGILSIPFRVRPRPSGRLVAGLAAAAACLVIAAWPGGFRAPETPGVPRTVVAAPATVGERVRMAIAAPGVLSEETIAELGEMALVHLHRIAVADDAGAAGRAIDWLAGLANARSLPALIAAADMADRECRAAAALMAIGPRALPAILPLLDRPAVFDTALLAVTSIGGPRAVDALALSVAASRDPVRRRRLLAALGKVDGRDGTRRLLSFLRDGDRGGEVLEVLEMHRAKVVPHLLDLAADDDTNALRALVLLAPPEAVPTLRGLLEDRKRRPLAARALARIDTPEAAAALIARCVDPAVLAAARFGGPGLETALLASFATAAPGGLTDLVAMIGEAGGDDSVAALTLRSGRPALGPAVVRALGRIGTTSAILALAAIGDEGRLRRPVIAALGATGDPRAVAELVRIGRAHRGARRDACRALANIAAATAVEGILLLEREGGVGREARRGLARMEEDLVRSALSSLVTGDLKPEAKRALHDLGVSAGPPRAVSLL